MAQENASRETPRDSSGSNAGPNAGSAKGPGRKGRRRYFQPKRDGKSQSSGGQSTGQSTAQGGAQSGQSPRAQENNRRGEGKRSEGRRDDGKRSDEARSKRSDARRRARSRQRYDDSKCSDRATNLEAEVAYVAPQSVYIYEHSVHPELRDSYEFRPDHFSKVGRTLADYQLDLSKLFPGAIADDGTPVLTNMLPKPQYDWTGWEDAEAAGTTAGETEQKG